MFPHHSCIFVCLTCLSVRIILDFIYFTLITLLGDLYESTSFLLQNILSFTPTSLLVSVLCFQKPAIYVIPSKRLRCTPIQNWHLPVFDLNPRAFLLMGSHIKIFILLLFSPYIVRAANPTHSSSDDNKL
jgi:hypothetical protein